MNNEYQFITRWRVEGNIEDVYDLVSHPLDFPRWWPSVYLEVEEISPGDATGEARRVRMLTRGWLPYKLRWESQSMEKVRPVRFAVRATGDFDGRGIWTLEQDGRFVNATFDWQLTAYKPLLRYLSFLLKPAFSANHRWAMAQGQRSLELELARRAALTPQERERVPSPPGPNRTSGWWLALGAVLICAVLAGVVVLVLR